MADDAPNFTIKVEDSGPRKVGRPAGASAAAPKTTATAINADVRKALATLDSAYNLIATGLTIFGLNKTAEDWADSAEQLKLTNEDALKASPKLAKMIASTGSTGGSATFLLTHGMALFGLFQMARSELADKRADAALSADPVPDFPPRDPTQF